MHVHASLASIKQLLDKLNRIAGWLHSIGGAQAIYS
jgi:hypothetical protein